MKFLSRVVWSEGMPLSPQHFQTQSRYFEDTLWFVSEKSRPYPYGLLDAFFDEAALRNGKASLTEASGILPDGLIFDILSGDHAAGDKPPEPVDLRDLFSNSDTSLILHLAIAKRRDFGLDTAFNGEPARYAAETRKLRDDTITEDENDVLLGRKQLLFYPRAPSEQVISFPIARILRDGNGGFLRDPEFIPPCLKISASARLVALLDNLIVAIEMKVETLRRNRQDRATGTSALDFNKHWFLHCLCASFPSLHRHQQSPDSHPQDLYCDLVRLAGALSTFALEDSTNEIPAYNHWELTSTFRTIDSLIRRYLEVMMPSNFIELEFARLMKRDGNIHPFAHSAELENERCLRRSRWILGIRSTMGESALVRRVPEFVKVCSARGIETIVRRSLPGLTLLHLQVPPSDMPTQPDMHYFSISLDSECWQDIQTTRKVGIYLSKEFGDADFVLTVITEVSA